MAHATVGRRGRPSVLLPLPKSLLARQLRKSLQGELGGNSLSDTYTWAVSGSTDRKQLQQSRIRCSGPGSDEPEEVSDPPRTVDLLRLAELSGADCAPPPRSVEHPEEGGGNGHSPPDADCPSWTNQDHDHHDDDHPPGLTHVPLPTVNPTARKVQHGTYSQPQRRVRPFRQ